MSNIGKIAILGFGTVGSGVAEVLAGNSARISQKAGVPVTPGYILDVRSFPGSPFEGLLVNDISVILNDPEVCVVVETIGGASVAAEYTRRALEAGKSVVTSNKELVARHGWELLALAKTHNVNYLFEASVGGGIPIIRPLSQCLLANRIEEVYGILNGTTNYILTQMYENGAPFEQALKKAQELGYAERDPADDISGADVCRKICILASLAFGYHIFPEDVQTEGIQNVMPEDMEWAGKNGYRLKLLGRAAALEGGGVSAYAAPHMIPLAHPLSGVRDVYNGIMVCGDAIGDVMFYGRGAGKLPTASAVVADVIDAVKHINARKYFEWNPPRPGFAVPPDPMADRWYARGQGMVSEKPKGTQCFRVFPD